MSSVDVRMFGKFSIGGEQQFGRDMLPHRIGALLCYLLLHRGSPQSREYLADVFWAECNSTRSKKYLRKTLWQLQKILKEKFDWGDRLLVIEPEWLQVNPMADLWLDVTEFESRYQSVQDLSGYDMTDEQSLTAQGAVDLYRGDLLAGWYDDWCLLKREQYREMYMGLLEKLMDHYEANRRYRTAIAHGERILEQDHTQEHIHLRLMNMKYQMGDRISAIRQYVRCRDVLRDELDVAPGRSLQEFYDHIMRDVVPVLPGFDDAALEDCPVVSVEIRQSLQRITRMIHDQEDFNLQLLREIQLIEATLA